MQTYGMDNSPYLGLLTGELVTAAMGNQQWRDNLAEVWHEVAYAEFTATVTATSAVEASAVTVVSAGALTFSGTAKAKVEFFAPSYAMSDSTNGIILTLFDGTTATVVGQMFKQSGSYGATAGEGAIYAAREFTPSAAAHTYFVGINNAGAAGTHAKVLAGAGGSGVLLPGFIRVLQKG